ncbi:PREDICTED: IQ and AAA domain-containing protein 1-like [Vollenhovia emeryi]|uniref:IQ and AAA domain-containing protein 1-like n=1 Tax=Vollenhovia emeryi TaxID=411798 RepID=UPI0005F4F4CD|nr:PREDICTED: IQ and AAA domain-containing protein 1-like [Vollenhovia emeryi]
MLLISFTEIFDLIYRYRNIVRRLIMCYDQMVQTQKRELIKKMLDCAIGRMLEYKKEIVKLDYTDYQWPDNILNQMKFTPDDIELLASVSGRERVEERRKFIQELVESARKVPQMRERSLSQVHLESMPETEDETLKTRAARRRMRIAQPSKVELIRESPKEKAAREAKLAAERIMRSAILLMQSHERARKGRRYGANVKRIYDYNKKVRTGEIIPEEIDRIRYMRYIKSAMTIQRAWRRYVARKAMKKRIARLEEALDMTIPSWRCRETVTKDNDNFQRRRALMPAFDAHTKKAISDERTRLLRIRGPGLMEDITDEIHEWFVVWYNTLGHYDVFPAADFGGSVLIVTGQTSTPQEYLMEKLEKEKQAKAKGRRAVKMVPIPKAEPIKSEVPGRKMPQTDALSCLEEANVDFIRNWSFRDENDPEKVYLDLITEKLCYELQLEMREIVDELMRAELELLNKALLKDHARDKEKFVIPTMGKRDE